MPHANSIFTSRLLAASNPSDVRALQELHQAAPGYSLIVNGKPPDGSEALETLLSLPPGKLLEDKFVFGYFLGEDMVGCAELLRGYPEASSAYIGLLLFSESHQGLGFGKRALNHVYKTAMSWGCIDIRLAVIETNTRAHAFWLREGFQEINRKTIPSYTGQAIVLKRPIPHS